MKKLLSFFGIGEPLEGTWENMVFVFRVRKTISLLMVILIILGLIKYTQDLYFNKEIVGPVLGYTFTALLSYMLYQLWRQPIMSFDLRSAEEE